MIKNVLSIAGSDPSGGAGIQADLKTFSALGCYGMAAITALVAENTRVVTGVHIPPAQFVGAQIDDVFADVRVDAVKIGIVATREIAGVVADRVATYPNIPIVLDPVLVATSGDSLGSPDVVDAIRRRLLPLATVVTPNLPEAARLAEMPLPRDEGEMRILAERLHNEGARAVLVKGGHLHGAEAIDVLFDGARQHTFKAQRIATKNTHGTGCTLSSAIAAYLALGKTLVEAIEAAKDYVTRALAESGRLEVGAGNGPVHHFHALWPSLRAEIQ